MLSNVSYMNLQIILILSFSIWCTQATQRSTTRLVIRLVFPTLWSPRRTILLRFSGGEEKSAVTGDVAAMTALHVKLLQVQINKQGIRGCVKRREAAAAV